MKRITYILKSCFVLIGILLCQSNTSLAQGPKLVSLEVRSQNEIPKRLIRKFKRDAARLALRMEAQNEDLRYLNINIPKINIDNIYKVLTNIYLSDDTAKSITNCNVHTFPNPSIDHFVLIFNRNVAWANLLREGITETSNEDINDLLHEYDLIIEKHVQWNDTQDAITIRSTEPLNMEALANEFYNIDGVEEIDFGLPKIEGNDIQVKRIANGWEVNYILKFGSHISGNGKTHIWSYQANDNGSVKFLSESGDPVPDWMRCETLDVDNMLAKRL